MMYFRHAIEETLPRSSIGADPTGGMTRLLYSPGVAGNTAAV